MTGFGVTPGCPDSSLPVLFFVFALQFLVGEAEGPVHCSIYNLILEDGALPAVPTPVYLLEAALHLPGRLRHEGLCSGWPLSRAGLLVLAALGKALLPGPQGLHPSLRRRCIERLCLCTPNTGPAVESLLSRFSRLVISDSLGSHRLQPTRLLCPWDSPGKNTGVGCHLLLQGIFPTQGSNLCLLHCRRTLYPGHLGGPGCGTEVHKLFGGCELA